MFESFRGMVLAHAKPLDLYLAIEHIRSQPRSGLVFCGEPKGHTRQNLGALEGRVILDSGRWQNVVATSADLFGLNGDEATETLGLFSMARGKTLHDVAISAPASASLVLSPTGFIPADQLHLIPNVLKAVRDCASPRLIPLIPTHARALEPHLLRQLCELLAAAHGPVALILADEADQPLGRVHRMAGLRALLNAVPDVLLLGCEPAVAMDAVLHGACAAAIGVNSGLRLPRPPHDDDGGPGVPRMFPRELWEHRSPATYAKWYDIAQEPEPECASCSPQRSFSSYSQGDRNRVYRHTLHAWLGVLDEVTGISPEQARHLLSTERRHALEQHGFLSPTAPLKEFDPVLRQLVILDDGKLPVSLERRRA